MIVDVAHFSVEWLLCEETFQQYCLGTDEESQNFWERWIAEHPNHSADFNEAKRLFFVLSAQQGNLAQQLNDLKSGISQSTDFRNSFESHIAEFGDVKTVKESKFRYLKVSMVAASLLLVATLFIYFNQGKGSFSNQEFSSGNLIRKTVVLKDGSVITLRKNSRLKISADFDEADREVWLTGEAFFNISHNKTKPFIVHAAESNILVLGTIFNVMAYPNASFTETTLLEGSVKITHNLDKNFSVILKPHQKVVSQIAIAEKQTSASKDVVAIPERMLVKDNLGNETSWVRNKMEIENESLKEIAEKLENFYGVNIKIDDAEVGKYRYSGTFENESLTKTLEALQLSYPFSFKPENNTILIGK